MEGIRKEMEGMEKEKERIKTTYLVLLKTIEDIPPNELIDSSKLSQIKAKLTSLITQLNIPSQYITINSNHQFHNKWNIVLASNHSITSYCCSWIVEVVALSFIGGGDSIGVAHSSINSSQGCIGNSCDGWELRSTGELRHRGSETPAKGGWKTGDKVKVTLDINKKIVSFAVNDQYAGELTVDTSKPLFPAIAAYDGTYKFL
eukprot:TRINITY_DN24013_c0_g1_i1.p1 TRINITY_DN24013_c0_g1~~TRINITY_DN24013_c0_g1_i1.p1  ORF type:complete len:237 (+),score=88.05 TRINITY_DN24013_c0_g1_i1:104-712(+)